MDALYSRNYKVEFLCQLMTKDLLSKCGECTNYEGRFTLALKTIVSHSGNLFNSESELKNTTHSKKLREDGNSSFEGCQYYQAVQEYTESIVYAIDSSEELVLAYANRSAALFKLKKYADCIEDIDRALRQEFPDRLKTQLYKRKGLCMTKLGDKHGADSSFEEALIWLDKMNLGASEMNKNKSELKRLISAPPSIIKPSTNMIKYHLPEIVTSNPEIPCASDAVAIKYSKKFGRHLVATRKINPGEILIVEKPYCLRLKPANVYTYCSYCLQVSWNLIPCKSCVNVAYCSEACRDKAQNEYHEIECSVIGPLLGFKFNNVFWIGMRTAIMATRKGENLAALKQELMNVDGNTDPRTKGYCEDGKYRSDQYRSIYSLANNTDKCSTDILLLNALRVASMICILAKESTIFGRKLELHTLANNLNVIFVGALILKNVHTAYLNTEYFGTSRGLTKSEHGHALMAVCSLLNHSCDPNILKQWRADCLAIYAAYPIEQGEQIFDCYGPRFYLTEKDERQSHLDNYGFKCKCRPCTENWPLMLDLPSYKKQSLNPKDKSKLDKVVQKFRTQNSAMQKGIVEHSPKVLNELLEMIELMFQLARRPCAELSMAVSMLKYYYEATDVMFDYEPVNPSIMIKSFTRDYPLLHLMVSRQ